MGMISHRVMPACDQLCVCCPAMRPRSRQPVKRYKKMLTDIFPRSPGGEPNERMINKLCEYASKNPLRIPKITTSLEQRFYRELRNQNLSSVKIVMLIYRRFLTACKQQMPLFAGSFLNVVQILLDQIGNDEMCIVGCESLFEFINNQIDATYMFNLEGLIPKICFLPQETGDEERVRTLRCAGLQVLSSMVWFMGEFGHMPAEFDNVVTVVLENYESPEQKLDQHDNQDVQNYTGGKVADPMTRVMSWRNIVTDRGLNVTLEDFTNPRFWSKVCLHNMAKLAKEGTTVRRVLESLFCYFDNGNLWSTQHGVALSVLLDMQFIMENSGHNTHFLLSTLIKHLDHKNVLKNPNMQVDIVEVVTSLAQHLKVHPSAKAVGAFSDMMRHFRKSIHCSLDDSDLGDEVIQWNRNYHTAVDKCLVQISRKVGDAGQILDVMAVMLESISNIPVMARNTIATVYRTAQIAASLPNISYQNKAFPEALFYQILLAMVSPDHETRIGAHRVFSVVLVPSSVCPCPSPGRLPSTMTASIQRTLSKAAAVFSSSAALFENFGKEQHSLRTSVEKECDLQYESASFNSQSMLNRLRSSYSRVYTAKRNALTESNEELEMGVVQREAVGISLKLKTRQISILLSSIWAQAISPSNTPENFEAIAHTYSLVLLFSQTKKSSEEVLIRSFQLAFSLRNISLQGGGQLPPSRRRSLFTLSTAMIIFLSKAYNFMPLVVSAKDALSDKTVDPFLRLMDDSKLQAINSPDPRIVYGSPEDDNDALKSLSEVEICNKLSTESFASTIVECFTKTLTDKTNLLKEQLLQDFLPDDVCPLGAQLFTEKPSQIYQFGSDESEALDEALDPIFIADNTLMIDGLQNRTDTNSHLISQNPSFLDINQLMDSVSEITNVGRLSVSVPSVMTFKDMANQCEALQMGKQKKLHFMGSQKIQENEMFLKDWGYSVDNVKPYYSLLDQLHIENGNPFSDAFALGPPINNAALVSCGAEFQHHPSYIVLPPASPYDNFLKAVGG
ncbi:unnamed protein product [Cuscuta epithymum]|uniref:Uncharacterized protein n=1 Tax=Cuscuta epithymum TaxID=186058 RepID=A0AAV0DRG7_9ASTE|nr:unnamed protein product [Cuscuta epithymum]